MKPLLVKLLVPLALLASACGSTTTAPAATTAAPATSAPAAAAETTKPANTETTAAKTEAAETTAPKAEAPADNAQQVDQLTMAIKTDESTINPYTYVTGYPGHNLLQLIHEPLLSLDTTNTPQNLLTSSYTMSDDGLTYTLELADGVTWHDGKPFTAEDVVFTFDYVTKHKHSRWTPAVAGVEKVEATDDGTVIITLTQAAPNFLARPLADMPMLAKHVWSSVDDPQNATDPAQSVGTGPYKMGEHKVDEFYKLVAHDAYNRGTPVTKNLNLAIIPDVTTAFSALRAGEVDMVSSGVEPQLAQQFASDKSIKMLEGAGFGSTLLNLNTARKPFDRVEVRRAIAMAIDKQALVDTAVLGKGTVAGASFFHPKSPAMSGPVPSTFDVDAANKMLDDLGATTGANGVRELDGKPISFEMLVYSNNPVRIRTAELVAEMLMKIGVEAKVTPLESDTVAAKVWPEFDVNQEPDYDASIWGWSAPVQLDGKRLVGVVHSDYSKGSLNLTRFKNAEADAAADALANAGTADEVRTATAELEKQFASELPVIMLYFADGAYAFRSDVHDGWQYQAGQGLIHRGSLVAAKN